MSVRVPGLSDRIKIGDPGVILLPTHLPPLMTMWLQPLC